MAAFIVYDTQNIIEKVRMGNRDVIQHALDLFFDVLSMFRRLLIILTQKVSCRQKELHIYIHRIYNKWRLGIVL